MKKFLVIIFMALFSVLSFAQEDLCEECQGLKTSTNDKSAKTSLLGNHLLTLQWIGTGAKAGKVKVYEKKGIVYVHGTQEDSKTGDYVNISGMITEINKNEFKFCGYITTKVSHINNGEPCQRNGNFTFAIKGGRKYWRLQEMQNACDNTGVVDYIDIYFK